MEPSSRRILRRRKQNDVRNYFAAVYAVLGEQSLTRAEQSGDDVILASAADVLKSKTASGLELALLTAALLENAGIHATFGRCSGEWYAGAFLTDDCFGETVIDEPSAVENRLGRGVNELSIVGVKGFSRARTSRVTSVARPRKSKPDSTFSWICSTPAFPHPPASRTRRASWRRLRP
ncbi:MAG: hypothetical protein ACLUSP_07005 [Christensenellales bacterium]